MDARKSSQRAKGDRAGLHAATGNILEKVLATRLWNGKVSQEPALLLQRVCRENGTSDGKREPKIQPRDQPGWPINRDGTVPGGQGQEPEAQMIDTVVGFLLGDK